MTRQEFFKIKVGYWFINKLLGFEGVVKQITYTPADKFVFDKKTRSFVGKRIYIRELYILATFGDVRICSLENADLGFCYYKKGKFM